MKSEHKEAFRSAMLIRFCILDIFGNKRLSLSRLFLAGPQRRKAVGMSFRAQREIFYL